LLGSSRWEDRFGALKGITAMVQKCGLFNTKEKKDAD
jgi:hypothetical protein